MSAVVQQNPAMPAALKDVACDVISALLEPIVGNLPWLPPEYASYLPKGSSKGVVDTDRGLRLPEVSEATFSTGVDASVDTLLGGVS